MSLKGFTSGQTLRGFQMNKQQELGLVFCNDVPKTQFVRLGGPQLPFHWVLPGFKCVFVVNNFWVCTRSARDHPLALASLDQGVCLRLCLLVTDASELPQLGTQCKTLADLQSCELHLENLQSSNIVEF